MTRQVNYYKNLTQQWLYLHYLILTITVDEGEKNLGYLYGHTVLYILFCLFDLRDAYTC